MQNLTLQSMRDGASRLLLVQLIITAIVTVIAAYADSILAAYSALMGGVVCVIANLFFIQRFFAFGGAQNATKIVRRMYWAEILKLTISGFLFLVSIRFWHVDVFPFLIGYFIVQCSYWLSPLMFKEGKLIIQ